MAEQEESELLMTSTMIARIPPIRMMCGFSFTAMNAFSPRSFAFFFIPANPLSVA